MESTRQVYARSAPGTSTETLSGPPARHRLPAPAPASEPGKQVQIAAVISASSAQHGARATALAPVSGHAVTNSGQHAGQPSVLPRLSPTLAHRGSLSASNAWTYRTPSSACERATSLRQDRRPDPRPQRPERMPVVWTSDNASRGRAVLCRRDQREGRGPDPQVSPRRLAVRIWSLTEHPLQHKTRLSSEHLRHLHPMPTRLLSAPFGRHRPACGWLLLLAVGSGRLWLLWWETDY